MPPRTGYVLPFAARLGAGQVFSAARAVEVRCTPRGESHPADRAANALRVFADLAATGALAGAGIRPADSFLVAEPGRWRNDPPSALFTAALIDESSAVVLANLLLACVNEYPLASVTMSGPADSATEVLRTDPDEVFDYPARYDPLPFAIEDEQPSGDSFAITAEFVAPPTDATVEQLRTELNRWVSAVQLGAYAIAPDSPAESHVETEDDALVAFDTTIEWGFSNLRADTACLDGLVNLFAAFHFRVQPLTHWRIS